MDPYVYPGTTVLRNLRDIRDAWHLSKFEAIATTRRTIELEHEPISGPFDSRHVQAIHHHIFQDVFEWAGDFRTVDISKSGTPFAFHQHIASSLEGIPAFEWLERLLRSARTGAGKADWVSGAGELPAAARNLISPFPVSPSGGKAGAGHRR